MLSLGYDSVGILSQLCASLPTRIGLVVSRPFALRTDAVTLRVRRWVQLNCRSVLDCKTLCLVTCLLPSALSAKFVHRHILGIPRNTALARLLTLRGSPVLRYEITPGR